MASTKNSSKKTSTTVAATKAAPDATPTVVAAVPATTLAPVLMVQAAEPALPIPASEQMLERHREAVVDILVEQMTAALETARTELGAALGAAQSEVSAAKSQIETLVKGLPLAAHQELVDTAIRALRAVGISATGEVERGLANTSKRNVSVSSKIRTINASYSATGEMEPIPFTAELLDATRHHQECENRVSDLQTKLAGIATELRNMDRRRTTLRAEVAMTQIRSTAEGAEMLTRLSQTVQGLTGGVFKRLGVTAPGMNSLS